MKIFLRQDVEKVGMAGEIITVSDGFALNYLLPKKLGIVVDEHNEAGFARRMQKIEHRKEIVGSKTSMLAERIGSLVVTVKRKLHDDGKLYGSLHDKEVADALVEHGITVAKNQIVIDKAIKAKGLHQVTVKLSSTLQPKLTVKVVPEEE
jgi:large subunit ribosomal protein L9